MMVFQFQRIPNRQTLEKKERGQGFNGTMGIMCIMIGPK